MSRYCCVFCITLSKHIAPQRQAAITAHSKVGIYCCVNLHLLLLQVCYSFWQRQTAATAYLKSKQLTLFAFVVRYLTIITRCPEDIPLRKVMTGRVVGITATPPPPVLNLRDSRLTVGITPPGLVCSTGSPDDTNIHPSSVAYSTEISLCESMKLRSKMMVVLSDYCLLVFLVNVIDAVHYFIPSKKNCVFAILHYTFNCNI